MAKYTFKPGEKPVISIPIPKKGGSPPSRGIITDDPRVDYLKRRTVSDTYITFYETTQINIGTVESPIWSDLPILKTPSYICIEGGSGAEYTVEGFSDSDYQSYLDLLFEVPVENWHTSYKKLEMEINPVSGLPLPQVITTPATYPTSLRFIKNPSGGSGLSLAFQTGVDLTEEGGLAQARLAALLDGFGWTGNGLMYKNIEKIKFDTTPFPDWYPASTSDSGYKVTGTYDPDASDLSDLSISGNIDIYLISPPYFWAAVGKDVDYDFGAGEIVFDVMFCYQTIPRQYYPDYFDPYNLLDEETIDAAFLDYQENRSGMVVSQWSKIASVFSEGTSDWDVTTYSSRVAASQPVYFPSGFGTLIETVDFEMSEPMLVAVIKMKGQFYYVWKTGADSPSNSASGYVVESEDY